MGNDNHHATQLINFIIHSTVGRINIHYRDYHATMDDQPYLLHQLLVRFTTLLSTITLMQSLNSIVADRVGTHYRNYHVVTGDRPYLLQRRLVRFTTLLSTTTLMQSLDSIVADRVSTYYRNYHVVTDD